MVSFDFAIPKTIVLIGIMGVGKTSIGRRMAKRLGVNFTDSDQEVESASMCSISDIYEIYGEQAFFEIEHRVIKRLLEGPAQILATGGTAFTNERTRTLIKEQGISVWLQAEPETLVPRLERRDHRPQFSEGNIRETLDKLLEQYGPLYAHADLAIDCTNTNPDLSVEKIILELNRYISKQQIESGRRINHV